MNLTNVCIIGSGFAGLTVGLDLLARGLDVTIIEAGGDTTGSDTPSGDVFLFPLQVEGDAVPDIDGNRTIAVGGTSRRWNGVVTRLAVDDFRTLTTYGYGADWPLSYSDLEPYYERAESQLEVHGGEYVAGAEPPRRNRYLSERPLGSWGPPAFASHLRTFPLAFGAREGAPVRLATHEARWFVEAGGTLLAGAAVLRLHCADDGRIESVVVRRHDGADLHIEAGVFVVAAGVVESARLLLSSRSLRFPNGIGNDGGWVGRGIHGHPRMRRTVVAAKSTSSSGVHRSAEFSADFRRDGAGAVVADINADGDPTVIDVTVEMESAASHCITLDESTLDQWGRPLVRIVARATERDRRARSSAVDLVDKLARLASDGQLSVAPELTWFHPAGGCRMAPSSAEGVVDRNGRVFDVSNLFVVGAATFPSSGAANPTLTVVAMALRLADHLAGEASGRWST